MPGDWELFHKLEASNTFQKTCYIGVPAPGVRPWQRLPPGEVGRGAPARPRHLTPNTPLDRTLSRKATVPRLVSYCRELMPEHCVFVRTQTAHLLPCVIHENVSYFELSDFFKNGLFQL